MGTTQTDLREARLVTPTLFLGDRLTAIEHCQAHSTDIAVALILMGETVLVDDPAVAQATVVALGGDPQAAADAVARAQL